MWFPACHGMVDRIAVVGAVHCHTGDLALDLLEQDRNLPGIVVATIGQCACDDLAGVGVDREVQLAPGPTLTAVLFGVPLALSKQLYTGPERA